PRTLLRFIASTDPSAALSSSANFPGLPVIRPTLLRRFLVGTGRVYPVAQHVLFPVLSVPPRQGEQPHRSVFGWSFCLRPSDAGSALGDIHFRGHNAFTFVTARGLVTSPWEVFSIGFEGSVSISSAIQTTGL